MQSRKYSHSTPFPLCHKTQCYARQTLPIYHSAIIWVLWEVILSCSHIDMTTLKMRSAKYLQNFKFSFRILSFVHHFYGKNQIENCKLIAYSIVTQAVG